MSDRFIMVIYQKTSVHVQSLVPLLSRDEIPCNPLLLLPDPQNYPRLNTGTSGLCWRQRSTVSG